MARKAWPSPSRASIRHSPSRPGTNAARPRRIAVLAADPLAGDVISGLGGVRKLRWAPKGRGKSGAFRVIYYVLTDALPVLALLIYGRNQQSNLSPAQRLAVLALVQSVKGARK